MSSIISKDTLKRMYDEEYTGKKGPLLQESFLKILRRTMLFLNTMLSIVVVGTLISML